MLSSGAFRNPCLIGGILQLLNLTAQISGGRNPTGLLTVGDTIHGCFLYKYLVRAGDSRGQNQLIAVPHSDDGRPQRRLAELRSPTRR